MNALVSVLLITYNQEDYVAEAIDAILGQSYTPLEVVISDDNSTDSTWKIINEKVTSYRGPHRIVLNRNQSNLGVNCHINAACRLLNGEFIVIAAGDDISMPDRVVTLVNAMKAGSSGVFSNAIMFSSETDAPERLLARESYEGVGDWKKMVSHGNHGSWGCALGWEKRVNDIFGDIPESPLGEDAFVPFRCALFNGLTYLPKPLVRYRDHGGNVSFWAREKMASRTEFTEIGRSIKEFEMAMLHCWLKDLRTATEHGLVSTAEEEWAIRTLHQHIKVAQETIVLLRIHLLLLPFLLVFYSLPRLRRGKRCLVRRIGQTLLRYRFPRTYETIQMWRGKFV